MAKDDAPAWFITGRSTGFGRELARAVLERGRRVAAKEPPLRLLPGAPALEPAYGKLDGFRAGFDAWNGVALGADCPEHQKAV